MRGKQVQTLKRLKKDNIGEDQSRKTDEISYRNTKLQKRIGNTQRQRNQQTPLKKIDQPEILRY
jgi:hypothetical protein